MRPIAADSWLVTFAFTQIQFSAEEQSLWQAVLAEFEKAHGQAIWVRDMATALAQDESVMRNFMYKAGNWAILRQS